MDRFKSRPLTTNRSCDDGNRSERECAGYQRFNPSIHYLLTGGEFIELSRARGTFDSKLATQLYRTCIRIAICFSKFFRLLTLFNDARLHQFLSMHGCLEGSICVVQSIAVT